MNIDTTVQTATPTSSTTGVVITETPTPTDKVILDKQTIQTIKLLERPSDRDMFGFNNGLMIGIFSLLLLLLVIMALALKQEKPNPERTKKKHG